MTRFGHCTALRWLLVFLLAASFETGIAIGQDPPQQPSPAGNDSQPVGVPKALDHPPGPEELQKRAWQLLTESARDSRLTETRTQALYAISSLGSNTRASGLITGGMKDPNLDVRTAAILAAGKARSRALIAPMKKLLDDPEPQVVFAAATTLWGQFKDKSGEDILAAIASGERRANPTLWNGARHDISRTLHSPSALEKIGIETTAGLVLGPFGFSVGAIEYARKNGADSARVQAIDLLGEERTKAVHEQMLFSLEDKDPGVRAESVKVLAHFHSFEDLKAIAPLLDDAKLPVRLAAAAAYIDCGSARKAAAKHP